MSSPSSFIAAGSRIARTIVASIRTLVVTERAVEKHVTGIFAKLDRGASGDRHRRVLADLRFLEDPA
jgi:hypothetical protein